MGRGDRAATAADVACGDIPVNAPRVVLPAVGSVELDGVGGRAQEVEILVELAVQCGDHGPDGVAALAEILLDPPREVVGQRRHVLFAGLCPHGVPQSGLLASGDGAEQAEAETAGRLAGHFRGADDGRGVGDLHGTAVRRRCESLRRPADPPGVEHLPSRHVTVEQPRAFDEERSLFWKVGLERGQVDVGRIGLHLAEVRVDRQVQREVGGQPVLQVEPGVELRLAAGRVEDPFGTRPLAVVDHRVRAELESHRL